MSTFHSPYHFVPMSQWVYMPDWAHLVSHDVPFADGLSGVIDYQLTTVTPLCVGGEQTREGKQASHVHFARDPLGQLVIPATSIKGMLRSVVEIATFSKFQNLDDQRLSFRDISSSKNHYLGSVIANNKPVAGWLSYHSELQQWQFRRCQFAKVHHDHIGKELGVQIRNEDSAVDKYKKLPLTRVIHANISEARGQQNNRWAEALTESAPRDTQGYCVFTNMRILGKGEKSSYEFSYFFYDVDDAQAAFVVDRQAQNLFDNHGQEQVDYLKRHGNALGMPVFALMNGSKVHSLGFARMPRVSYENSTHDMIRKQNPAHHSENYFDLSELMFGCLREYGFGLRSRLSFSDLQAQDVRPEETYPSNLLVLNGPKPSFYPAYVEQNHNQKGYRSYEDDQPLAGIKRYISRAPDDIKLVSNGKEDQNLNVASRMELCPSNKHFQGQIVFHNLKPIELGALLWTMQLEAGVVHQLGHGKPMGAGAVTLQPTLRFCRTHNGAPASSLVAYIEQFVTHMNQVHPAARLEAEPSQSMAWQQSPQIQYLLGIGRLEANAELDTRYLDINQKQFQHVKTAGDKLALIQGLSRQEKGVNYQADKQPSSAYAQGRLAGLFEQLDDEVKKQQQSWHEEVLKARDAQEKAKQEAIAKAKAQAAEAEKKASMSEHAYLIESLTADLQSTAKPEQAPKIRAALEFFITNIQAQEQAAAEGLYKLARKYDYHKHKKNKAKHVEQLDALCTAYQVTKVS